MSLVTAALIVSLEIALFMALPFMFGGIRKFTRPLMIIGALVLFAFCFLDLIPEMMELGGAASLLIVAFAWAIFTGIHYLQAHDHSKDHETGLENSQAGAYLLLSMALHCFAGGMLLVGSYEISANLAFHVFVGLLAHKAFEAIAVASAIADKVSSRRQLFLSAGIYAISFPAGVVTTIGARAMADGVSTQVIETIAMVITSVAVGSLLGCLLQDYLIPAYRGLRGARQLG